MQQMKIWLVILFFSRKKFLAKQICVLGSSIKLGPGSLSSLFCSVSPLWTPLRVPPQTGLPIDKYYLGVMPRL